MVEHEHHSQQTGWFCGTAAMHMLLDTPAVRNNNPIVAAMLTNPPPANPPICLNVIPFPNPTQEQWVQYQLYCASRPRNAAFFGPGTSPEGVSLTMNAYDGPPNGPDLPYGVPQGGGNHTYAWWGFPPTVLGGDRACKTMAAALKVYNIPAVAGINWGGHWVVVDGVQTTGNVAINGNYNINWIRVSDPWPGPGSLGKKIWYRYGFFFAGDATAWFNFFTPNRPGPYAFSGQYAVIVEPDPVIPPDDGTFSALPDPPPVLPQPLTADNVIPHLQEQFVNGPDAFLGADFASGGSFVQSLITFKSYPGAAPGEGDWLIPFDGPASGNDDLLGAVSVNARTGVISQAMRLSEGDVPLTLAELEAYYDNLYALNLRVDECPLPGDVNHDGHADGRDIKAFLDCLFSAGGAISDGCICADGNGNGDIDASDVAPLVSALLGAG